MRALVLLLVCGAAQASPCYTTAEAAAQGGAAGIVSLGVRSGYRLDARRWDALLGRGWATVSACGAPERPAITVAIPGDRPAAAAGTPAVTGRSVIVAGDPVRLVYREQRMQMELSGVAEGNGNVGDRIAVRVVRASAGDGGAVEQRLTAIVRGPHALELVTAGIGGRL